MSLMSSSRPKAIILSFQVAADKAKETTNNIFLPFFLTKYSAIIAEMKGYFRIEIGLECAC